MTVDQWIQLVISLLGWFQAGFASYHAVRARQAAQTASGRIRELSAAARPSPPDSPR